MHRIRTVLIDLSGTLHIENEIIPGSLEALNKYIFLEFGIILNRTLYRKTSKD